MKKLLNSPIFVGIMCAVALSTLVFNSGLPSKGNRQPNKPTPAANESRADPKTAVNPTAETPVTEPGSATGTSAILASLAKVQESDRPSPFSPKRMEQTSEGASAPKADEVLRLTATYEQSGRGFAVINGKVLSEGEEVLGYQLDSVRSGEAVVNGPLGPETLQILSPRP